MASLLSSSATLHHNSLSLTSPSAALARAGPHRLPRIRAVSSAEPQKETPVKSSTEATKTPVPTRSPTALPKKPVYSMKKGQIVRVDKEKYLNSINYLSVGHPPYYKGLDYIYEDRGEVLELRIFETGEHALGCDGSILIRDPDDASLEKKSSNHAGLRGFDVIDRAKARLEAECEGVVSCTDIVALAARDAVYLSRGPYYDVPTGRRDGRVSNVSDAFHMPDIRESVAVLKAKFAKKGLSEKDLVLLSAAHTIGTTACFFLEDRLYNFFEGGGSDPSINPHFLPELKLRCPAGGDINVRLPLDPGSETVFDMHILRNIRSGLGVIESDAKLYADASTRAIIDSYLGSLSRVPSFDRDFAESMVRMGMLDVHTGSHGEIRRVCSRFN